VHEHQTEPLRRHCCRQSLGCHVEGFDTQGESIERSVLSNSPSVPTVLLDWRAKHSQGMSFDCCMLLWGCDLWCVKLADHYKIDTSMESKKKHVGEVSMHKLTRTAPKKKQLNIKEYKRASVKMDIADLEIV
jgi:hypothetical protein